MEAEMLVGDFRIAFVLSFTKPLVLNTEEERRFVFGVCVKFLLVTMRFSRDATPLGARPMVWHVRRGNNFALLNMNSKVGMVTVREPTPRRSGTLFTPRSVVFHRNEAPLADFFCTVGGVTEEDGVLNGRRFRVPGDVGIVAQEHSQTTHFLPANGER